MKRIAFTFTFLVVFILSMAQDNQIKDYSLITDLPDTSSMIRSVNILLDDLEVYSPEQNNLETALSGKKGMVIFLSDAEKVNKLKKLIGKYARSGGTIVMDIRSFGTFGGYSIKDMNIRAIRVKEESDITSGYKKNEPIQYSYKGQLKTVQLTGKDKKLTILGENEKGEAALFCKKIGSGRIVAVDMLSLPEPRYAMDTENKYLFMVNAIGNKVKYGRYFPEKLKHNDFVAMMHELGKKYPAVKVIREGEASGGHDVYSLNMGNPANPGMLIFACTHGNEWENAYGTFRFVEYLAENQDQNIIDFNKYCIKVIPILNPYGYENITRQNANLVDLNRNGDYQWERYKGESKDYKPGDYDWKGTAPFSEPESRTLVKAAESGNYIAFLDIHGNPSGTGYNKWIGVASTSKSEAGQKVKTIQDIFNESVKGRYILRQGHENIPKPMNIDSISLRSGGPNLFNSIGRDKYGYLVELLCGYGPHTAFIVMQSDLVTEMCIAFCKTFAP